MLLVSGGALVGLTVLMVLFAWPDSGEPVRFLRSWPVGQAYLLAAMASAVSGVTLILTNLPLR